MNISVAETRLDTTIRGSLVHDVYPAFAVEQDSLVLPGGFPVGVVPPAERPDHAASMEIRESRAEGLLRLADAASRLTTRRADILCQLLRATCPGTDADASPLRPIWELENFARAGMTIRLLASMDRLKKSRRSPRPSRAGERDAADRVTASLSLLQNVASAGMVPASTLLSFLARDLVELFGPAVGGLSVAVQIEPLMLPRLGRRALLLAACNLILRSICDGFPAAAGGTLLVSLRRIGERSARLIVADDGHARDWDPPSSFQHAIDDLAAILDGEFAYATDQQDGKTACLTFPIIHQAAGS